MATSIGASNVAGAEHPQGYIDSVTALRGVAALWVVLFHFHYIIDPLTPEATGLVGRGYLWVDFFFVLSGFIICHVYGDRFARGASWRTFGRYLEARFSRIYPLHLFTLCLMVGFWAVAWTAAPAVRSSAISELFDTATIPQKVALLDAMGTTKGLTWNPPSWSISAEWWTYVVAVLLFPVIHLRRRAQVWGAIAVALAGLAVLEWLHPSGSLHITADLGVLRCLFGFTLGVAVYQLYRTGWCAGVLRRDLAFAAVAIAILGLLHRSPADVLILPAFALLLLASATNDGHVRTLLNARPMRYLGEISYSIYMVQAFWIVLLWTVLLHTGQVDSLGNFGTSPLERSGLLLLLLALIVTSSGLTYRYLECPARDWFRRAAKRRG